MFLSLVCMAFSLAFLFFVFPLSRLCFDFSVPKRDWACDGVKCSYLPLLRRHTNLALSSHNAAIPSPSVPRAGSKVSAWRQKMLQSVGRAASPPEPGGGAEAALPWTRMAGIGSRGTHGFFDEHSVFICLAGSRIRVFRFFCVILGQHTHESSVCCGSGVEAVVLFSYHIPNGAEHFAVVLVGMPGELLISSVTWCARLRAGRWVASGEKCPTTGYLRCAPF